MNPIQQFLEALLTGGAGTGGLLGGAGGDRLQDPASARVSQAFDTVAGGPQGGMTSDQARAYFDEVNPRIASLAGHLPQTAPVPSARSDPWAAMREPAPQPDPMQTAGVQPQAPAGNPYNAWQRGMGSSDDMPMPGQGSRMAGSGGNAALMGGGGGDRLQGAPSGGSGGGIGGLLGQLFNPGGQGRNRTVQWLTEQGMDPGTATLLASDKDMLRGYLSDRLSGKGVSEFDQRAAAAQQYGLDPATEEGRNYILSGKLPDAKGGAAEVGLQPLYGQDASGNPVVFQLSKSGEAVLTRMPDGVTVAKNPIEVDTGTGTVLVDPITRQPIATIQKDIAGAESAKKFGQARGEASFDLPRIEQNAAQTLEVIDRLKKHPGRTGSTGFIQGRLPAYSGNTMDFQVALEQAKGKTFLEAYQTLKGGGQITEVEGAKAEAAIARLNRAQSDDEFLAALTDFEQVIKAGLDRARQQAGVSSPASDGGGWNDVGGGVRIRRKQ